MIFTKKQKPEVYCSIGGGRTTADMDEVIFIVTRVIEKGYDKETLKMSAYWDLRDNINDFWVYVDEAKKIGLQKFIELYKNKSEINNG